LFHPLPPSLVNTGGFRLASIAAIRIKIQGEERRWLVFNYGYQ
jgi:hypothetical protein